MFQILKQTSKLIQSVNILPLCQISITKELAFIEDNSQQKSIFWNSFSISLFILVHNCLQTNANTSPEQLFHCQFSNVGTWSQSSLGTTTLFPRNTYLYQSSRILSNVPPNVQCTKVQCTKCPMKESPRILLKQFYEKSTFGFPPHSGSLNPLVKANISE